MFILKSDNSLKYKMSNLIFILQRKLGLSEDELCVQDHMAGNTGTLAGLTADPHSVTSCYPLKEKINWPEPVQLNDSL